MNMNIYKVHKVIHWGLFAGIILYLVSGLGITQSHIIEPLTFGLFTKSFSFKMHSWLLWPFLILLVLHIVITMSKEYKIKRAKSNGNKK